MSIITKALKKAQEMRMEKQAKDEVSPVHLTAEKAPPTGLTDHENTGTTVLRKLISVIVSVVLILGGLAGVLLYLNRPLIAPSGAAKPALAQSAVKSPVKETSENKSALEEITDSFSNLKNNFARAKDLPVLNGIMYTPNLPQAIINGVMVSEGETIDGFSILKIFPDKVTIASEGKEFELKLR